MKYVRLFFYITLFLVIGEIVFRVDKTLHPFDGDDTVNSSATLEETGELAMLHQHSLPINDSDVRVMVLGDSYIHGAGINSRDNFSHQLRTLLERSGKKYRHVFVLDVSRPSNNNLDNYNTYFEFVNQFKPQVVVLGYNLNDIDDNLDPALADTAFNTVNALPVKSQAAPTGIQKAYDFLYHSELVHSVMKNFNNELKSMGYVIPGSRLGQQLRSYYQDKPNWLQSKMLLNKMLANAEDRKIKFMCFFMPEMDLLESPKIFTAADTSIHHFFGSYPGVAFINGRDVFKGLKSATYRISKYDGHPNEKAHLVIAGYICRMINDQLSPYPLESSRSYTHN